MSETKHKYDHLFGDTKMEWLIVGFLLGIVASKIFRDVLLPIVEWIGGFFR